MWELEGQLQIAILGKVAKEDPTAKEVLSKGERGK